VTTRAWARLRLAGGAIVLAVLVWRLGTGPFLDGLRTVDLTALVAGLLIGVPTTVCCAWRWRLVARRRGLELSLRDTVGAYHRSQLLNTTLPGGVVGDVHRAVRHGIAPVALERVAGQVVQVGLAALALLTLSSPLHLPAWALVPACLPALVVLVRWPRIALASVLAVVGHLATFWVAARTAGVDTSSTRLLPLALVVLVAMSIPANVAGWGPREGVAAWLFAAAGLGAAAGVTTAVVCGVMALVAALPGVVVLVADRRRVVVPEPTVPREVVGV
jgi:hypothetical protein